MFEIHNFNHYSHIKQFRRDIFSFKVIILRLGRNLTQWFGDFINNAFINIH